MKIPMPKKSSKRPAVGKTTSLNYSRGMSEQELAEFTEDVQRFNKAWGTNYEVLPFSYLKRRPDAYFSFSAKWLYEEDGVEKYAFWLRYWDGEKIVNSFQGDWAPN